MARERQVARPSNAKIGHWSPPSRPAGRLVALNPIRRLRLRLADQAEQDVALRPAARSRFFGSPKPPPPGISTTRRSPGGRSGSPSALSSCARAQRQPAVAAGPAAVAAARRIAYPLEGGEDAERPPSRCATSITWPEAAAVLAGAAGIRAVLLLPDHQRARCVSVISTGTLRTPDGKGVADRPSRLGRAPAPPEWKVVTMKGPAGCRPAPVMPWPAPSFRFHRLLVPSAGTRPGIAWCRAS